MKHFQKISICLILFIVSLVFMQADLQSQTDSLVYEDSLVIGDFYKVKLISGEEVYGKFERDGSNAIKLTWTDNAITIKKANIKMINKIANISELYTDINATVTTKNGFLYKGRLLSITDKEMLLINNRKVNNVNTIEKDIIKRVKIHGESNIWEGLGYGTLIGTSLGVIIGFISGDDKTGFIRFKAEEIALYAGISFGVLGGLVGLIVGLANSTPEEIIEIKSDEDFNKLTKYKKDSEESISIRRNFRKKKTE